MTVGTEGMMTYLTAMAVALALAMGASGALADSQLENDPARAAQIARDLQYKNMVGAVGEQISSLSAAEDGAVWALTGGGKLMHCLFDKARERVRCYDRDGAAKADY